jgi:hypothetical protein
LGGRIFGIAFAPLAGGASLLPPMRLIFRHEEADRMIHLRQRILASAMAVFMVSACAFAQKNDNKRPEKPNDTKVVVKDKDKDKPPPNNNRGNDNKGGDKKEKP